MKNKEENELMMNDYGFDRPLKLSKSQNSLIYPLKPGFISIHSTVVAVFTWAASDKSNKCGATKQSV